MTTRKRSEDRPEPGLPSHSRLTGLTGSELGAATQHSGRAGGEAPTWGVPSSLAAPRVLSQSFRVGLPRNSHPRG